MFVKICCSDIYIYLTSIVAVVAKECGTEVGRFAVAKKKGRVRVGTAVCQVILSSRVVLPSQGKSKLQWHVEEPTHTHNHKTHTLIPQI